MTRDPAQPQAAAQEISIFVMAITNPTPPEPQSSTEAVVRYRSVARPRRNAADLPMPRGRPSAPALPSEWPRRRALERQGCNICFRRIGFRMNSAAPATSRFMMVATTNTECQEPV